jgi:hypothetical protein
VAASEVDIINEALLLAGQKETIASRSEQSVPANIANALYDGTRDEVLASAPWPFARKHAILALLPETRTGWKNVYQLPNDCISSKYISDGSRPGLATYGLGGLPPGTFPAGFAAFPWPPIGAPLDPVSYSIESSDDGSTQVLLTDQDLAELIYTSRITNTGAYPPLFLRALKQSLASKFSFALPIKAQLGDMWEKKYRATVLEAIAEAFRAEREDPEQDARHIAVRG